MSEFLRYDSADYNGTASSTTTIIPASNNLSKTGLQAVDCRHHNTACVHLTGTWVGTVQFEGSNDGVTWVSIASSNNSGVVASSTTGTGMWNVPLNCKYFRVRCIAYTSGTIICKTSLSSTVPLLFVSTLTPSPSTSAGASSTSHLISAATTNATSVKTSGGNINTIVLSNNGVTVAYFKLYNKASAPTVGTDTPVLTALIPINGTVSIDCGPFGIRLGTGIAFAITGGMAVADTTAVALSQVSTHINYT